MEIAQAMEQVKHNSKSLRVYIFLLQDPLCSHLRLNTVYAIDVVKTMKRRNARSFKDAKCHHCVKVGHIASVCPTTNHQERLRGNCHNKHGVSANHCKIKRKINWPYSLLEMYHPTNNSHSNCKWQTTRYGGYRDCSLNNF